ncbi:MAG: leucyl-tRNA synthetase [Flavipsychrobacter sp.]|nr:leucyl-tRNA synthetase [Flavipsychrobacter sp.]
MEYDFRQIEANWKKYWNDQQVYKVTNDTTKPKCYILDMFPYPSGAGLHVGHPLGYIASDIYARYKRLNGYNVLHPMGFDAFGLPAEQYALETGQHPSVTTKNNTARYREQLDNISFSFDWSREVNTSDPKYYKWTQWIFLQLFHSWYDRKENKARPITELVKIFEQEGNVNVECPADETLSFDKVQWADFSEQQQRDTLMQYRIAYQGFAQVWWCEALGTVLANDEVVNGVSERGGHPVERKNMRQWFLRITEYADRLMSSLDNLDWSDAMKEMQRNWIGKSNGAEVRFDLSPALSEGEGDVVQAHGKEGWNTAEPSLYNLIGSLRKDLKNNPTEAESILWQRLKANQLGFKFRRQHIIGRFVPDFVCLSCKLIVEVDGKIHEQQKEEDAARTEYLEEKGYKVVRFTNEEIIANIDNVIDQIRQQLTTRAQNEDLSNTSLSFGEVSISVFTTRPDTIFGVDFMVLAPEHELVDVITTDVQKTAIDEYRTYVKSRSERERMSEVKLVTGCFTGSYAIHPLTGKQIPVWISEYVLAGYGTGAIMAVPSGDDRDHAFAKHFNIPVTNIFGERYNGEKAYSEKNGTIENSDFLSGKSIADANEAAISALVASGAGKRKVNYKLRDAGFSRQRYWGEPFPIVYVGGVPYGIDEKDLSLSLSEGEGEMTQLPVELPMVEHYKPGPEGQGPLANIIDWVNMGHNNASLSFGEGRGEVLRETNTMPGYAGSSWYFLRYMDPHNDTEFAGRAATDYWQQVDLYVGGTEHAVGHLLYARMWTKALYDLGYIGFDEPFKKLLNQGMIQGQSYFIGTAIWQPKDLIKPVFLKKSYRNIGKNEASVEGEPYSFLGKEGMLWKYQENSRLRYGHLFVDTKDRLTESKYREYLIYQGVATDVLDELLCEVLWEEQTTEEGDKYIQCKMEVEKMSKSKYNVVNPDDIVNQYGADTFRMYEMFLGPIDVSKPWDTKGIEGVHRFLKKLWRLYADDQKGWIVTDEKATDAELRILHKTIKKIADDIERFSFNTSVSQFMICVNDLSGLNCHKREILEPLTIAVCPFAPHIAEELWHKLGHESSVINASFPKYEEKYVTDNSKVYPVAVNGKTRAEMEFPLDAEASFIQSEVLSHEAIQKWMEGKEPKKFIYVKGKMINVVV